MANELYEWKHLPTGKTYTVFMSQAKADKQLADLNKDGVIWERKKFFDAILEDTEAESPPRHELWAATIHSEAFEIFCKLFDGREPGTTTVGEARDIVEADGKSILTALDFWTWTNKPPTRR